MIYSCLPRLLIVPPVFPADRASSLFIAKPLGTFFLPPNAPAHADEHTLNHDGIFLPQFSHLSVIIPPIVA